MFEKEKDKIKNTSKYFKIMALAGVMAPLMNSYQPIQPKDKTNKPDSLDNKEVRMQIELIKQEQKVDSLRQNLMSLPSGATYNGVKVEYSKLKPQDIGHIFESGMNPLAMNARSIVDADFLGYYQMSLDAGGLMSKFVSRYGNKYPELKDKALKSEVFFRAYKSYATGKQSEEFHDDMFELNYSMVYQGIFEKLADKMPLIPKITKENCSSPELLALAGAVMSCANQNPQKTTDIFVTAYQNIQKQYGDMDISKSQDIKQAFIISVVTESYNIRKQKWGLSQRYKEESKLAKESGIYLFKKQRYEEEALKLKEIYQKNKLKPKLNIPEYEHPKPINPLFAQKNRNCK